MGNWGDRVASLEPKSWARQAWNMAEEKRLPWANKIKQLTEEVGLDGAKVQIGLGTLQMKVKTAVAERDRRKSQEVMKHKK